MAQNENPIRRFFGLTPKRKDEEVRKASTKEKNAYGPGSQSYYQITRGGYRNPGTGSGTANDKMRMAEVIPTYITQREYLEILGAELWQIKKLIHVIAQDMTSKWREFKTDDKTDIADTLIEQEKKHDIKLKIQKLIRAGRQYGTAVAIMVTKEAPMEQPLIIERLRPDDLVRLEIVDRFDLEVHEYDYDVYSETAGEPIRYIWNAGRMGRHIVHSSRVLRYDAEMLAHRGGHQSSSYDSDWGLSVIIQCLLEVFRDEDMAASVQAQMLRAGVLAVQSDNVNQMIAGGLEGGEEKTLDTVLNEFEAGVRSNRMIVVSSDNDVSFLSPNFANMGDIMDRMAGRLAAAFDIPQTRLWGKSPQGMNATGESDENQYSDMIKSLQEAQLDKIMNTLDLVLAADAGLGLETVPNWVWNPYRKEDQKKVAEISKLKAEAWQIMYMMRSMTEDEIRAAANGDQTFGELPAWEGEMPDFMFDPMGGDGSEDDDDEE